MARPPHFLQPLVKGAPDGWRIEIAGRGVTLADALEPAFDSATRNKGLLGRDGLTPGAALVIAPTNAIHTFGMRFPIDVVFAARDGRVLKIRPRLPRGRIALAWGGFAVIEMAAGEAARAGLLRGDVLELRRDG
jgi:uncharacterized membrane protein (UPF0127 family)